jgi:hypothetical protein
MSTPTKPTVESNIDETKLYLEYLRKTDSAISIRELLSYWGYKGRSKNRVALVSGELARMGLRVTPPFDSGHLDTLIAIERATRDVAERAAADRPADHLLTLSRIESSTFALRLEDPDSIRGFVTKETAVTEAVTLMMRHDFSQLPIIEDEKRKIVVGVFTWHGYAQCRLRGGSPSTVGEAMDPVQTVDLYSDLFASVAPVTDNGYVVVSYRGELAGIVTASDLTFEFQELALPFLAVGRCERELKRVAKAYFHEALSRSKKALDEFTFGNLQELYRSNWGLLGWALSQSEFDNWLDSTRKLRNSIAHFDDDQDADLHAGLDAVDRLTRWLAGVTTSSADSLDDEAVKKAK